MTDFALENLKLVILFMLIGTILVLSHINAENLAKMKSALMGHKPRAIGPNGKSVATAN